MYIWRKQQVHEDQKYLMSLEMTIICSVQLLKNEHQWISNYICLWKNWIALFVITWNSTLNCIRILFQWMLTMKSIVLRLLQKKITTLPHFKMKMSGKNLCIEGNVKSVVWCLMGPSYTSSNKTHVKHQNQHFWVETGPSKWL